MEHKHDHTTLDSKTDGNSTSKSYIPEVTHKVDVNVNIDEEVQNKVGVLENIGLTQLLKEILILVFLVFCDFKVLIV